MTIWFQSLLFVGSLLFSILVIYMVKRGRLSIRYSFLWLTLGGSMLLLSIWPDLAKMLRALVQIEVVSNLIFVMLFCFVLLVLMILCAALTDCTDRLKRLTQVNALLEERIRQLEERDSSK